MGGVGGYETRYAQLDHPSAVCSEVISEATSGLAEAERVLKSIDTADKLAVAVARMGSMNDGSAADRIAWERELAANRAELRSMAEDVKSQMAQNRAVISACSSGAAQIRGAFYRYELEAAETDPILQALLTMPEAEVDGKIRDAKAALAEAQAGMSGVRLSATRQEALTLDAFLRGWSATYSDVAVEGHYDAWVRNKREAVWGSVAAALRLRRQDGALAGWLQRSNIMFRVEVTDSGYVVTPMSLIAGDYLIVADPADDLVRFESMIADQHLATDFSLFEGAQP